MASVLILGAGSDIAMAMARKWAEEKFDVVLAARRPERLQALESDIRVRYEVNCRAVAFDALQYDTHQAFFDSLPTSPEITICVFGLLAPEEEALNEWPVAKAMIDTNFTGAVSILNIIALRYMTRNGGTIIGISSVAGERGRADRMIYSSAKAGFTAYLSGLRNLCFPKGVHVMTVLPGYVYSRMTEKQNLPPMLTSRPEEVARIVFNAYLKKKNTIYVKWFWMYIMLAVKSIPEFLFKKMKL